ncbi:hypothetical protein [Hyphobacterium sp.]|uniref:hypothetical protein n=1 Tax=Hyphobacterium sp. TaxID=2004662 RepID=UPI003BA9AE28
MQFFERIGAWLAAWPTGQLGLLFLVLAGLGGLWLIGSVSRLYWIIRREGSRRIFRVEVVEADDVEFKDIRLSNELYSQFNWIERGKQIHLQRVENAEPFDFEHVFARNAKGLSIHVHPDQKHKMVGTNETHALMRFRPPKAFSPFSIIAMAVQSPARRSELIIGFWFVVIGLGAEWMLGWIN